MSYQHSGQQRGLISSLSLFKSLIKSKNQAMRKTILIWLGIFSILCFVIYIPVMEENYHIKNDPHYLDGKYQFRNNLNDESYYIPPNPPENIVVIKVDTVKK